MTDKLSVLTQESLKEMLHYNPDTGVFTWIKRQGGNIAGTKRQGEYVRIYISGKYYFAHRLAYLYMDGKPPKNDVDHIDHAKGNNRWSNLREVTHSENLRNASTRKTNTSGFNGVCWHKACEKWTASIMFEGKRVNLGYFADKGCAIEARKAANTKYAYHSNHGL